MAAERPAPGRWGLLSGAGILLAAGVALFAFAVTRAEAWRVAGLELLLASFGWGHLLQLFEAAAVAFFPGSIAEALRSTVGAFPEAAKATVVTLSWSAAACWAGGWALLALWLRRPAIEPEPPSEAVGAPLYPRLANYRDFYWRTLLAYGGGILLAELGFVFLYTRLVSSEEAGGPTTGLSPPSAFAISLFAAFLVAFIGGFLGAMRARRMATPEATIAILYAGVPVPLLLTLMHSVPQLTLSLSYRLREVSYLAGLLGRPELGYWLVFAGMVLALVFGITTGFVVTSSGKIDLRAGFELFVSARHVQVFRPGMLLGALAVLVLGIIPPLLIFAILRAAENAVVRTRIRSLGLADPLNSARALHELRSKEQSPTEMMTALSVGGVGVGVMALIIVLSVMSGFELDLQKKILGTNAHAVVLKYSDSMPEYDEVSQKVRSVRGVTGVTPFIHGEGMVSSEGNISGALIKGIDPKTVGQVTDLPEYMQPGGSLEGLTEPSTIKARRGSPLDESGRKPVEDDILQAPTEQEAAPPLLPGIVVGREMAQALRVVVGDRINLVSPLGGELGPQGPMPKSRPFRVAGIFYSGMFEYDSKMVYISLAEAQTFFGVKGATGVELKVADIDDARRISKAVYDRLEGWPYRTKDWGEMNRNLFSALRLEKLVMAIILTIIVIVAAGLIVATVIMLVLEKRKEISVLKALGVPDGGIVKIFLAEGLQIGVAGGVLGLIAGLSWCLFIEKVGIKLDPEVYYIPALPVRIEWAQTVMAVLIAVLVTFLASIYPALKAAQVEPVDGLKAE